MSRRCPGGITEYGQKNVKRPKFTFGAALYIHWLRVAVDTPSLELLQAMTNFEEILASRGLETVSPRSISAADDGISTLEGPALLEYAATCNDPSGFEVRKHVGEAHEKTRHPDDCEATQTGSLRGWNEARQLPPTRFSVPFESQSVGNRSSWGRPDALAAALRLEPI